jgi:hypothetical protein
VSGVWYVVSGVCRLRFYSILLAICFIAHQWLGSGSGSGSCSGSGSGSKRSSGSNSGSSESWQCGTAACYDKHCGALLYDMSFITFCNIIDRVIAKNFKSQAPCLPALPSVALTKVGLPETS